MSDSSDALTYAIVPGIGEGRLICHRMHRALRAAGYREAPIGQASVIITHSGGIYVLPAEARATTYLHLNVTHYMTYGQLLAAHRRKLGYDLRRRQRLGQTGRWLLAALTNGFYLLNLRHGLAMRRGFLRSAEVLATLPTGRHIFVGGIDDGLSDSTVILGESGGMHTYLSVEAGHDDCWREPEPYVALLRTM
jgi:hypothetical protein